MEEDKSNVRRCGQIGEGDDDVLSMEDVLNEHDRLQADADAVLGASDEHNCSYPKGYLNRQALYACSTCSIDGPAGVCLACSYACHEGHDLYELYTKRNFRCDCGNEKFGTQMCKLYSGKTEPNTRNRYNHNFKGAYCSCSRPFPDPEDSIEDEMIQCIVCEDWYHGRHLNIPVPETDFSEMICPMCMTKHPFLWAYQVSSDVVPLKKEEIKGESSKEVDVEDAVTSCSHNSTKPEESNPHNSDKTEEKTMNGPSEISGNMLLEAGQKREREESSQQSNECTSPKKAKHDVNSNEDKTEPGTNEDVNTKRESSIVTVKQDKCVLETLRQRTVEEPEVAAFWQDGWRQKLCQCAKCMEMYKDKEIEFLLDESDTVKAYEDRGKERGNENDETMASALSGMNRVQQIEVVSGIMDFKSKLNEFLQNFAREGKVVTESAVREFFQQMQQQRRRNQVGLPQPFCR